MAKRIADMTEQEAVAHRAKRVALYAQNPEQQRAYSREHKSRKAGIPVKPPRPVYSPADYAEEWEWLTSAGVLSSDIIAKSTPSKAWFKKHITGRVKYSNCPGCGRKYLVAKSGTLLICGRDCPKHNYTEDYHVSRGRRELEVSRG